MLNYIKFFVYTSTLFFCSFGFGQTFIIDFDDAGNWTAGSGAITSYQTDHEYNDQNWLFTGGPALRNGTAALDGFPGALGTYSWRLRDDTVTWSGTYNDAGDIVSFGFDVRRWDGSPNPDWDIEYSTNGGGTWTNVGNINNTFLSNSSDWISFSYTLPSVASVTAGDFVVQVSRNGGERIMIDNFTWSEVPTTINISTVSSLSYVVDCFTGELGEVDFTTDGSFNIGNELTVQLSDATGSFANPIVIGTLTGTDAEGTDISGVINYTIPPAMPFGNGYRIRLVSSDPIVTSADNGSDITITLSGDCIPPHMTSMIINACNSTCTEGQNELIFGNTGDYEMDFTADNGEIYYGSTDPPTDNYTEVIVDNPSTTSAMNTDAGCAGLFVDAYNTTIPANSSFVVAYHDFCPGDELDFSGLCGTGPIYIIYTDAPTWSTSGNFVNDPNCNGGIRYIQTNFTTTVNTNHVIDYNFECGENSGTNGDYAVWDYNGGAPLYHHNNGCELSINVLPISLVSFTGLHKNRYNYLEWITETEQYNDYFMLYHSNNGIEFEVLAEIQGGGNSTSETIYSYNHYQPNSGINYYRLKSVDFDGTVHNNGTIAVLIEQNSVFYDPITAILNIDPDSEYRVYSSDGRLVECIKNNAQIPFSAKGIFQVVDIHSLKSTKIAVF